MIKFVREVLETLVEAWKKTSGWKRFRLALSLPFLAGPLLLLVYPTALLMAACAAVMFSTGPRFLEWESFEGWWDDVKFHYEQWRP